MKKKINPSLLFAWGIIISTLALPLCMAEPSASAPVLNAGLPASFDPMPNYTLCTDPKDFAQLSDGVFAGMKARRRSDDSQSAAAGPETAPGLKPEQRSGTSLWGRRSTVGWMHTNKPILISFDLGSVRRIGGMMLSSAAGSSGVYWPAVVAMVVSDDGRNWSYAGELISHSRENGLPPAMGYSEHQFVVGDLNVQGRYVGICVNPGGTPFFFTDELEIYGSDSKKPVDAMPLIGDIAALREYVTKNAVGYSILRRLALDYSLIRIAIRDSALEAKKKEGLDAQLKGLAAACNEIPKNLPTGFRTVIPINDTESRLLSIRASLLREKGYPSLLVSKLHRNANLGWLKEPPGGNIQQQVELSFRQMRDETRGDMLLLTNARSAAQKVILSVSPACEAMSIFYCPWTDTPQLEPVATALLPAPRTDAGWEITIPAGLTMKVWVSLDAAKMPIGKKQYQVSVIGNGAEKVEVVMKTDISTVAMGAERLHLGMWDYTAGSGAYEITSKNRDAAIRLMRSHGVDSPWGKSSTLPFPKAEDFDADDKLVGKLDFTEFDEWVALWPNARRYMVFVHVNPDIGGVSMNSPRFPKRVAQWARTVADHAAAKGIKPGQIQLLLVDEPFEDRHDELLVAWAKPIKEEVGGGLAVWSDPAWKNPQVASHPQAFELPDALCPNWCILDEGGEKQWEFYQKLRKEGKPMELYMCSALAPHTDPNRYYRMMPWGGWRLRIQGVGFWAFSDAGGLTNAWCAYEGSKGRIWYTPAFLGEDDATDSIQWQAVREGLLDYEYLRQLEKRIPDIKDAELKKEAQSLLSDEGIESLFHGWTAKDDASWENAAYPDAPDNYRARILTVLEKTLAP